VSAEDRRIDLARLSLSPGQARSLEPVVTLEQIQLGGQPYTPGAAQEPRLDVSRTTGGGYALRLRYVAEVSGPCVRCLEQAELRAEIDAREIDQPSSSDAELRSPYVSEGRLDAERWANDALVLSLPAQPLCRDDCRGLCAVCGESLNDTDPTDHRHEGGGDPRMAKLRELRLD
jgi:uncharacterized protein